MNSRGCHPRWTHSNENPTRPGSNPGAVGREFGPVRADDLVARPTVGCRPRLVTWKPSGFRSSESLACKQLSGAR